jgi:hypothetical protein
MIALIHTIWMLMDMEQIVESHEAPLPRAARRRALRSLKHGTVNVITLRRAKHQYDSDHVPIMRNWTCRWIVQGHWRHYRDGHKTWIHPYIKGPDGMPIKDTKQLWRLSR